MSEHQHRFGQTWRAEGGMVCERWCVDCDQWVEVEPIPIAQTADFPRERKRPEQRRPESEKVAQ